MERAAGAVVLAGFAQFDAAIHRIDYVDTVKQVVNKALRDHAGHKMGWDLRVLKVKQDTTKAKAVS
jgi:hypothetical protein